MKTKKTTIKAIIIGAIACAITAAVTVGTTLAFLTSVSESKTNTFTIGQDVSVNFTEEEWDEEDNDDEYIPGDTKHKVPTVTAGENSVNSYMRIKMELKDSDGNLLTDTDQINKILDTIYYDGNYTSDHASCKIEEGTKYTTAELEALAANADNKVQKGINTAQFAYDSTRNTNPAVRYYTYNEKFTKDSGSAVLFTNVVIPADWVQTDIDTLKGSGTGYQIVLTTEAIQADNFDTTEDAWKALDEATKTTATT